MTNRIPKSVTKLLVTSLINTSALEAGETMIAEKTDHGWVSKLNGKRYFIFNEYLRDASCCRIEIIS